jgi:xylulose-5-phosphate/fructose-6-phosphate phosphoketolase
MANPLDPKRPVLTPVQMPVQTARERGAPTPPARPEGLRQAPPSLEEVAVSRAQKTLSDAFEKLEGAERKQALSALAQDPEFRNVVHALGTYENAANALAVAMTYLKAVPDGAIKVEDVATKIVGHIGATTAISRTYSNMMAAVADARVQNVLDDAGITQTHVVTGPGHGAAANFALLFFEGVLTQIYPERYPLDAQGLQNLIADFCRPHSPLPSHVFPGVPTVSEGGELGYSLGIAAGAGLANRDSFVLAQIGDKEAEVGPLQAAIENHNAVYDFRKGLVLPVVHANGLGISGTSIISARTDDELRSYLWGLGYHPRIIDAENTEPMKKADALAKELDVLLADGAAKPEAVDALRRQIRSLRDESATITNAELQQAIRRSVVNLATKKKHAIALDGAQHELEAAKGAAQPGDELAAKRIASLEGKIADIKDQLRLARTPFIVYREAKGGGHAPAWIDGKPTKGAPPSHQIILQQKDLLADDPRAREHLQRWLDDLTRDVGVKGLLPTKGTPLGDAASVVLPREALRVGNAPMGVGKGKLDAGDDEHGLDFVDPMPFSKPIPDGGRGTDVRGSNDLVDEWLARYTDKNRGDVFFFGADTAESNKLKKTVHGLGRRLNLEKGEHHPSSTSPLGEAIDILSEQYLSSLAQGVVNSGKQAIITNYEAFHQVSASMLRQFIKFRKQAVEANDRAQTLGHVGNFRPPVPNLVLHLSSLAFAQDHNGFSHQNPGLVDDLAADPRRHVQVFMPADANSALLMMDRAVRGTDNVVAVVADKQPRKQLLSPEEGKALAEQGALELGFASHVPPGQKPDVVLAVSGGYHTDEVLAATRILSAFNDELASEGKRPVRFKTVAVAEPFKMRPAEGKDDFVSAALKARGRSVTEKADATVFDDATFDKLFPKGAPVVWSFGGFKRTAEGLVQGRDRDVSVHGYINEGSTTTRLDMMVQNRCDRFTIAADAVERAFRAGHIDEATKDRVQQFCAEQLIAHDERMKRGDGDDPQWIKDGPWLAGKEALAPPA